MEVKITAVDKVVELREDRSLFARLLVVCKSSTDIYLKYAIGKYEFSVILSSMFAVDERLLHYPMGSNLLGILGSLTADLHSKPPVPSTDANLTTAKIVVLIDAMDVMCNQWVCEIPLTLV